jgi:hypothetical protein
VATQNPEPAPIPAVESPKGSLSFIDQTGKVFTLKGIDIPDGLTGWVFATDNVDAIKAQLSEIQQTQQAAAQQASQPTVPQGQGYAPAQGAPVNHGGYAQQGYEQQLQYAPQGGQFGGQAGYGPQMSYGAQGMQMGGMPMQQAYNRNQQQSFGPQQFGQQQMQPGGQQFSRYPGQQNMGSQPTMNNPQMMYQQQGQPMMQQYGIQQQSGRPGGFAMSQQGQGGAIHNPLAMGQQPAATPAGQGTQSSEAKKPVRFVCYLE